MYSLEQAAAAQEEQVNRLQTPTILMLVELAELHQFEQVHQLHIQQVEREVLALAMWVIAGAMLHLTLEMVAAERSTRCITLQAQRVEAE